MAVPLVHSRLATGPHLPAAALAVVSGVITLVAAEALDLPLRDPDGIAGPAYVRLPLILMLVFAADIVPRAIKRRSLTEVVRERWSRRRVWLVLVGLFSFYVTYVAYRNLKSFLPTVRDGTADWSLLDIDRAMAFGRDPGPLLHDLLGTGIAAHALSVVYVFFLVFVPISLAFALVWAKDVAKGFWYVTALGLNWILGIASYYLLPSLGPVFAKSSMYDALPETGVSRLQDTLWQARLETLANPAASADIHGIAGFASLHIAIVFTAALMAQLLGMRAAVRRMLWAFLALTALATIYFGWHYIIDDFGGLAIGALAVWLAGIATGHDVGGMFRQAFSGRPSVVAERAG